MATISKIHPRPYTFRVDNIIIDEYAEKIGAIGVAIYNVLARYADRVTGICYPCIGTIAKKLKLGRTTVKKYLRILLNHCLIAISPRLSDAGDPTSNLYILLDPSPEQVALRKRKLEAFLTPQEGTFNFDPPGEPLTGGGSPDDRPPCPGATDPQSPADPEQSSPLNKKNGTRGGDGSPAETPQAVGPTDKQQTCAHPPECIVYLSDHITICHHCYGLLDENLQLLSYQSSDLSADRQDQQEDKAEQAVCAA